ncbi:MAG: hypothetical protein JXQ75_04500 [Phycisphaerae bacterium]|nr:hypothetical protein [Phycisphaerae bacterium]
MLRKRIIWAIVVMCFVVFGSAVAVTAIAGGLDNLAAVATHMTQAELISAIGDIEPVRSWTSSPCGQTSEEWEIHNGRLTIRVRPMTEEDSQYDPGIITVLDHAEVIGLDGVPQIWPAEPDGTISLATPITNHIDAVNSRLKLLVKIRNDEGELVTGGGMDIVFSLHPETPHL